MLSKRFVQSALIFLGLDLLLFLLLFLTGA